MAFIAGRLRKLRVSTVVFHVSRNTSEMWGTQGFVAGRSPKVAALGLGLLALALLTGAAHATTWNAKTSWGATGNGSTNDGPAIQAGVAKISFGDTVYFPAGTYVISKPVTFSTGAVITCQAGTVLQGPNTGTDLLNIVSNTTVGGSASTGCIFSGGGISAYGSGGDGGQTLSQAISNLSFTYNTFENMTYGPNNNFRTNGGIFLGGGSNDVVIRYNTFTNIMPYNDGYNAAGSTYLEQYDPDGDEARAAIWFYGASNLDIDHNTFLHNYQNIKACQGQQFQSQNMLIHHNYSDSHHRMFLEINTGSGCGNATYNPGMSSLQVYANYDVNAGGPFPETNTFGFSMPMATAGGNVIPMTNVAWYNNVFKGVVNNTANVGIGMEVGAEHMNIYNNTVMGQWPLSGGAFEGTSGGYMQDNYGCIMTPSQYSNGSFGNENGSTTVTFQGNVTPGACPAGNASLSVSLGTITNTSGTLTGTATVSTVEYGMQGVVFSIDGNYASAAMGSGPYNLNYSAAGLSTGSHTVTATVVDAVGVLAVSNGQPVSTTSGTGPTGGPIAPNVLPSGVIFDIAGNASDPINGPALVTLNDEYLSTPGSANTMLVGGTLQFGANCVYSDGSITGCNNPDTHGNQVTAWSSSNPAVVTVNSAGLATAIATGIANIQATVTGGAISSAWTLTVNTTAVTLNSVSLATTGGVSCLKVGATNQLIASCHYSDGSSTTCNTVDAHGNSVSSWSSSAPTVATVNAGGLVTAIAVGSTNLSAWVAGNSSTSLLSVAAAPPTLVSAYLSTPGSTNTLAVGQTLQFSAMCVYPSMTTDCSVADIYGNAVTTWSTSNAAQATIGAAGSANAGLATALGVGSAQIQATIGSTYSSPWGLTINLATVSLANVSILSTGGVTGIGVGRTNQLEAICTYSDGSTTACNTTDSHGNYVTGWMSSNLSSATVSATGLVTGVAAGLPTFIATAGSHASAALPLTVSVIPAGSYTITINGPVSFTGSVHF
jgi:Pectate lyase superfamily protein/Bacterial Ig-like domain (group 2)/Bacterial Ig domain